MSKKMRLADLLLQDKIGHEMTFEQLGEKLGIAPSTIRSLTSGTEASQLIIGKILRAYKIDYDTAFDTFEDMKNMRDYAASNRYIDGEQVVKLVKLECKTSKNNVKHIKIYMHEYTKGYEYFETMQLKEARLTSLEKCFGIDIVMNGINAVNKYLEENEVKGRISATKNADDFIEFTYLPKKLNIEEFLKIR